VPLSTPFPPLFLHFIDNNSLHQVAASLGDLASPSFLAMLFSDALAMTAAMSSATGMAATTRMPAASATGRVSSTAATGVMSTPAGR